MTAGKRLPTPPRDLGMEGRRLWRTVLTNWEVDERELLVVADACRQADRAEEARQRIASDGVVVPGATGGLKPNPAVQIEATAMKLAGQLLASVGIKTERERDSGGRFAPLRAV
jgi:phage terminase small subunit